MFPRCKRRKKDGKTHEWGVVESRHCGDGPAVQRQVLYRGEIGAGLSEA